MKRFLPTVLIVFASGILCAAPKAAQVAQVWMYESDYARLVAGSATSLKVMTNGLQGIFIGDTNTAVAAWGWPYDGLTFTSFLPDYNEMIHGAVNAVGNGGWVSTVANASPPASIPPYLTVIQKLITNGVMASSVETDLDPNGAYFVLHDGLWETYVSLKAGDHAYGTAHMGDNLIKATWLLQDRFTVGTNGNVTGKTFTVSGTENQVTFGATNTPPASTAAPTKWISVQVSGESTVYRLPLYE